jgi:hypothetical protein
MIMDIVKEKIVTNRKANTLLSIGDKLYKYITLRGIGVYEVCGFIDDFILVKSTFCKNFGVESKHPCIVKINKVDGLKDVYKYVEMMQTCGFDTFTSTDDDGEEIEIDRSYMWHTDDDGYYYVSKKKCAENKGQRIISDYRKKIENKKQEIKNIQSAIENMENHIKDIENWINGVELK